MKKSPHKWSTPNNVRGRWVMTIAPSCDRFNDYWIELTEGDDKRVAVMPKGSRGKPEFSKAFLDRSRRVMHHSPSITVSNGFGCGIVKTGLKECWLIPVIGTGPDARVKAKPEEAKWVARQLLGSTVRMVTNIDPPDGVATCSKADDLVVEVTMRVTCVVRSPDQRPVESIIDDIFEDERMLERAIVHGTERPMGVRVVKPVGHNARFKKRSPMSPPILVITPVNSDKKGT